MDGWLKALISAACVAVIGSAGWFVLSGNRDNEPQLETSKMVRSIEKARHRKDCERYVGLWQSGNRLAVKREFGDYSESMITSCLLVLEIVEMETE
ncbi:MAG: hypothetical protein KBT76_14710 [Sulfitobacter litoralis]|nr:hypothetical protein [Sulfitobacter litoralis]